MIIGHLRKMSRFPFYPMYFLTSTLVAIKSTSRLSILPMATSQPRRSSSNDNTPIPHRQVCYINVINFYFSELYYIDGHFPLYAENALISIYMALAVAAARFIYVHLSIPPSCVPKSSPHRENRSRRLPANMRKSPSSQRTSCPVSLSPLKFGLKAPNVSAHFRRPLFLQSSARDTRKNCHIPPVFHEKPGHW